MIEELKKKVKPIYVPILYTIFRYIYRRKYFPEYLLNGLKKVRISSTCVSFFGYYNIVPFNFKGDVLFCSKESPEKKYPDKRININSYNIFDEKIRKVGESGAWNWQQGCLLQWFKESDDEIIYNDYDEQNSKYLSRIVNIENGQKKDLSLPIYSVSKKGDYALTLNFERLAWLRPDYGYFAAPTKEMLSLEEDGIWKINFKEDSNKLIISLRELRDFNHVKTMDTEKHKVNHIDIAPDSEHFMFLHRWFFDGTKYTRLIVADKHGKNLKILCGDQMVSHCIWKNNEEIVGFANCKNSGNKYYVFNIYTGEVRLFYPEFLCTYSVRQYLIQNFPHLQRQFFIFLRLII